MDLRHTFTYFVFLCLMLPNAQTCFSLSSVKPSRQSTTTTVQTPIQLPNVQINFDNNTLNVTCYSQSKPDKFMLQILEKHGNEDQTPVKSTHADTLSFTLDKKNGESYEILCAIKNDKHEIVKCSESKLVLIEEETTTHQYENDTKTTVTTTSSTVLQINEMEVTPTVNGISKFDHSSSSKIEASTVCKNNSLQLSLETKIGIGVSATILVILIAVAAVHMKRRKFRKRQDEEPFYVSTAAYDTVQYVQLDLKSPSRQLHPNDYQPYATIIGVLKKN